MPAWTNQLPPQPTHTGFTLRRTPPDTPIRAIITCDDLIGTFTHYYHGRTTPCEPPDCPACKDLSPARWHGYVSCLDHATREHFLFEFTSKAAEPLIEYRKAHGTLHGCFITASRPKRRRNARVEIACRPTDLTKITLPKPPDLIQAMSVIWQLPATALETPEGYHESPLVKPNGRKLLHHRSDDPRHHTEPKRALDP